MKEDEVCVCVCVCVWVNYRMLKIIIVASICFLFLEPKSTQTTLITHTYLLPFHSVKFSKCLLNL